MISVKIADSREDCWKRQGSLAFAVIPLHSCRNMQPGDRGPIGCLKVLAEDGQIPIDGMVLRYDSLSYSKSWKDWASLQRWYRFQV